MSMCSDCVGACCKFVRISVQPMKPDERRWAKMHGSMSDCGSILRISSPCKNLIGGQCSIYDNRPQVCKDYEAGGKMCKEAKKAAKEMAR